MSTERVYSTSSVASPECKAGDCPACVDRNCECPHHFSAECQEEEEWWADDQRGAA